MKITTTTIWTIKHYKLVLFCVIQLIFLSYFLGCNASKKIPQKGNELVNKKGYHLEYGSDSTWGRFSIIANNQLFVGQYMLRIPNETGEKLTYLLYHKFQLSEISDSMKIKVTVDLTGKDCENTNSLSIMNSNLKEPKPYSKFFLTPTNEDYYIIDYCDTDDMVKVSYIPGRSIDIPNFFNLLRGKEVLFEYCFIQKMSTETELESCDVYTSDLFYKFY